MWHLLLKLVDQSVDISYLLFPPFQLKSLSLIMEKVQEIKGRLLNLVLKKKYVHSFLNLVVLNFSGRMLELKNLQKIERDTLSGTNQKGK